MIPLSRKAHPNYTHDDLLEELNKNVVKYPHMFQHYKHVMLHESRHVSAPFRHAPRMAKIVKDMSGPLQLTLIDYTQPVPDNAPSVYTTDAEFAELPISNLKPLLGKITINNIPMIGIAYDLEKRYPGSIIHLAVIYLDNKGFARAYTPKTGNAMNPLTGGHKDDTLFGYDLLDRYGDTTAFKAMDRHSAATQALLYDADAILKDIQERIVKDNTNQ